MADIPDPWMEPIIVTNQSGDGDAAAAWRFTTWTLSTPSAASLDAARTAGCALAAGEWVFHLDPDEWVPEAAMEALGRLVQECGDAAELGGEGGI